MVQVRYVFQTIETSAPPRVMDAHEKIAEFREVGWAALARLAQNLESLSDDWYDWGRYRAIAHRFVYDVRFPVHG